MHERYLGFQAARAGLSCESQFDHSRLIHQQIHGRIREHGIDNSVTVAFSVSPASAAQWGYRLARGREAQFWHISTASPCWSNLSRSEGASPRVPDESTFRSVV